MACYHPLPAWYSRTRNESGKRGITFSLRDGFVDRPIEVPCGTCVGCRLERARQWAVRCMHEAKCHERNAFVTLTYKDVPPGGSLRPGDFVDFMKRLRWSRGDERVRYFQCGEYGDKLERPHHHALLFGVSFPDARYAKGEGDTKLHTSDELDRLWSHGQCWIGEVSFESAGYVARYGLKSIDGKELGSRAQPYLTMSRRPGIGREWADRHRSDWYRADFLVVNGVKVRPPRYYDDVQGKAGPSVLARVKARRRKDGAERAASLRVQLGPSESYVREEVKLARIRSLSRGPGGAQ